MARRAFCVERLHKSGPIRDSDQNRSDLVTLDLVTNAKTQFLVTKSNASRTDPELVTLDGVTNSKTQFLVTKSGPFWCPRTDARTRGRTHTHRFLELHYTISPSSNYVAIVPYCPIGPIV